MSRLTIDTGTAGNPATGDSLRGAFTKVNTNFEEIFQLVGDGPTGLLTTSITNGDIKIQPNGTGVVEIDLLQVSDNTITPIATNANLVLAGNGTGKVTIDDFTFSGNILSTTSSNANMELDPAGTGNLVLKSGDFLPATTLTQFLGSASKRWHTLYVGPGSINIDGVTLSVSGGKLNMGADIEVNAISSADSTAIQINDAVNISGSTHSHGSLTVTGDLITLGRETAAGSGSAGMSGTRILGTLELTNPNGSSTMAMGMTFAGASGGEGQMVFEGNNASGYALVPSNNNQYTLGRPEVAGPGSAAYWKNLYVYNVNFPDLTEQTTAARITVVGDDSTGTTFNAGETVKIAGAGGVTTAVSGDTLTITGGGGGNLGSLSITESTITSTDSSAININENLIVDGTLSVNSIKRLILDFTSSDGSSITLSLDSSVHILAGAESDTKTYILPDGEATGQTVLLVRGSGQYGSIELTCLKLKVDGTVASVTFEPFGQFDHVVIMVWKGDSWVSTRTGTTP